MPRIISNSVNATEKRIEDMKPGEILSAIRRKDFRIIKALTKIIVFEKPNKPWRLSYEELVECLEDEDVEVTKNTLWRWANE